MASEFDLIARYFSPPTSHTLLAGGDDAALIGVGEGMELAVSTDMLVGGRHFLQDAEPYGVGYKSLAVNLSDIAAMGGIADYVILSLGIPPLLDSKDIDAFYRGFATLGRECGVALIGGDTNAADKLIVSVCVIGHALARPVTRRGARPGEDIYVTGKLGDSALGLKLLQRKRRGKPRLHAGALMMRHQRPTPRLSAGALLAKGDLATAMIDVSDGLVQDLGHICRASGVGATLYGDRLPLSAAYRALCGKAGLGPALSGGEDYELLFCARRRDRARIEKLPARAGVAITRIGLCTAGEPRVVILDASGKSLPLPVTGHDHFKV